MDAGKAKKKKGFLRKILKVVRIIIAVILVLTVVYVIIHHVYEGKEKRKCK